MSLVGPKLSGRNKSKFAGPISVFSPNGGWHDVVGVDKIRTTGGTVPTFSQIGATNFWANKYAVNDEQWFAYHILHDYVAGSAIYLHVHYLLDGTNVNTVKWQFRLCAAKGHQQSAFDFAGATTTLTVEQTPTGTQYAHMIAEIADPGFSSAQLEPDSVLFCHVKRITNGGTENTDGVFMLMSDLHYRSNGSPTKNKSPNFYT